MAQKLLDDDRRAALAVDAQVEHGAGVLQGQAKITCSDLKSDRILTTAVHNPRDVAFSAQATDGT
jgi:hypothetical protein